MVQLQLDLQERNFVQKELLDGRTLWVHKHSLMDITLMMARFVKSKNILVIHFKATAEEVVETLFTPTILEIQLVVA